MRYFSIILLLVFFGSCQNVERTKKPEDLIPEDRMVDVLTEISLVHGARSYNKQMLEQTGLKPEEYIWRRFNIDSAQFARSNDYYARNYQQYQRIYDRVKLRLENLKMTYDSLREEEERRRDSILKVRPDAGDSLRDRNRSERERGRFQLDTVLPDSLRMMRPEPEISRESFNR